MEWLATTGLRKGQVLSLTWESFDRETKTLRLHARDAKTRRGRVLALDDRSEHALAVALAPRRGPTVGTLARVPLAGFSSKRAVRALTLRLHD